MVKIAEKTIFIQEYTGERNSFDPVELQSDLIRCFLAAGQRELSYMAEDIALAVEYTLLNSPRPELIFGRGEIGAAVIRMLEETGFPDVATIYRNNRGERQLSIAIQPGPVEEMLRRYLACPPERFTRVLDEVFRALSLLKISEASPHLILELARHYEREAATQQPPAETTALETKWKATIRQAELYQWLPPEAQPLLDAGVLRIGGISGLFPCIRIFFMMEKFATFQKIGTPVTEMELTPALYEISALLEKCRCAIVKNLNSPQPYPVNLSIPDMSDFVVNHLGCDRIRFAKIGRDLARLLTAELNCEIYKLSLT